MVQSVVVGVDGSTQSRVAAEWAAQEARRSGRTLRIVHIVAADRNAPAPADRADDSTPQAVADVRDRLAALVPDLEISLHRIPGDPAYALAAAGGHDGLLVLGSHGLGSLAGHLLGSVALRTAAHADCPTVVVRAGADGQSGDVVVGVEGGRACDAVLRFAFEQAAGRGAVLRAVESRTPPSGPFSTEAPVDQREIRDSLAAAELLRLQDALARWREKFPEVRTEADVVAWSAAASLAEASRGASLLVVGRRTPHHPMAAPRLGPVARSVLHRAHCPVAVVPHD